MQALLYGTTSTLMGITMYDYWGYFEPIKHVSYGINYHDGGYWLS